MGPRADLDMMAKCKNPITALAGHSLVPVLTELPTIQPEEEEKTKYCIFSEYYPQHTITSIQNNLYFRGINAQNYKKVTKRAPEITVDSHLYVTCGRLHQVVPVFN